MESNVRRTVFRPNHTFHRYSRPRIPSIEKYNHSYFHQQSQLNMNLSQEKNSTDGSRKGRAFSHDKLEYKNFRDIVPHNYYHMNIPQNSFFRAENNPF